MRGWAGCCSSAELHLHDE
jgi:hypothetical protein